MIKLINTRHYNNISRYSRNRQLYNTDTKDIYLESTNRYNIKLSSTPIYHIVDFKEEGRLDKIAQLYYGDPTFYWAIAMANGMIDPFVVKADTILVIPYIEDLFNNDGPLAFNRN